LTSINWPSGLKNISDESFAHTGLSELNLPEGITSIESDAFFKSAISYVTFPSTLESISSSAFAQCPNLVSADMSACQAITALTSDVFRGCGQLSDVKLPPNLVSLADDVFRDCKSLLYIELPEGFTTLDLSSWYSTFKNSGLTEIVIPKSLINIGNLGGCPITVIKYRGSEFQWNMTTGYGQFPNAEIIFDYAD